MVHIPTGERKYYNTTKKLNSLAAYSSALLPAAQQWQENIKEQQKIKMDTYSVDARIKMNEATNEWRMANQSNPNNPEALQQLQFTYDNILGEYREQIDPMYRSQWDIQGNKLKGAFDLDNQGWEIKQSQQNVRNDIASSIDNYYKLAYSYGQNGEMEKALVDFTDSYDKLLDYGAKNLGTEDAAMLLKDYRSNFYTSYLDGLVENNPSQALKMLNSKEFYGVLDSRDYNRYKKYAKARQKEINKDVYTGAYNDFLREPTKEGLDRLYKLNPNMKEKTKTELNEIYENSPDYEARTIYEGADDAKSGIDDLSNFSEETLEDNAHFLDNVTAYVRKLQRSNAEGKLSKDDVNKYANLAYRVANEKMFAEQVHSVFGQPSAFSSAVNWTVGGGDFAKIKNIGLETINNTVDRLLNNDVEGALTAYKEGQKKAIQVRYPEINFTKLKEGDIIWYTPTKQALKFVGYGVDDVLVEVDPQTGVVK